MKYRRNVSSGVSPRHKNTVTSIRVSRTGIAVWKGHHIVEMPKNKMSFFCMLAQRFSIDAKHFPLESFCHITCLTKSHFLDPSPVQNKSLGVNLFDSSKKRE